TGSLLSLKTSHYNVKKINFPNNHSNNHKKGSCDIKSCGALDPVSDPVYNMQQIVKQSTYAK
ncbi:MAG: hypothetical protein WCP46_09610, partial [Alphaproteobacteria bacterium]